MKKITFKNPKGGTLYLAKVGFDWGAFWGMLLLAGLPFFLRKMNVLGTFGLIFLLISTMAMGLENIETTLRQEELGDWEKMPETIFYVLLTLGISLYFGIRGGKLTAHHYVEEGYECLTKDEVLLARARAKWGLKI